MHKDKNWINKMQLKKLTIGIIFDPQKICNRVAKSKI